MRAASAGPNPSLYPALPHLPTLSPHPNLALRPASTRQIRLDAKRTVCDTPRVTPRARLLFHCLAAAALFAAGCTATPRQMWDSLKGDGFTGWNADMGAGVRGNKEAKPSGFVTDRRSEQIEKDLGGFE